MGLNNEVAQREVDIFNREPTVKRCWDLLEEKNIYILKCFDIPQKGVQSCGTVGLNNTDIGLQSSGRELRVELLGASDVKIEKFEQIIASVALDVMDSHKCYPGYIAENIISQYIAESDMKHVLLTDPFLWENTESLLIENTYIAWLMIVPISHAEYEFAKKSGVDELEKIFEKNEIDIYNIYRRSVI